MPYKFRRTIENYEIVDDRRSIYRTCVRAIFIGMYIRAFFTFIHEITYMYFISISFNLN